MKKNINTVYLETDLSVFKVLEGNRSIEQDRINKIIQSIKKVGFVPSPIVVNEKMEVIDGQGRLEACKQLYLPIPYIKIEGIGIDECLSMNINQKNWQLRDYIDSYAERGNKNYIRCRDFLDSCGFTVAIGLWLLFRKSAASQIKDGTLSVTEQMLDDAVDLACYMHKFDMIETNARSILVPAIAFALKVEGVTKEGLEKAICKSPRAFAGVADVKDCVGVIEDVFNKGKRSNRVYIRHAYEVAINQSLTQATAEGRKKWLKSHRTNARTTKEE